MSFDIYDGLSDAAKELAAAFCDYVKELMDLDDLLASGRLGIANELDDLLQDLREKGAHAYFATRDRKFRGPDWGGKPSWELTVGFLVIVPADQQLNELYVPRKSKFA